MSIFNLCFFNLKIQAIQNGSVWDFYLTLTETWWLNKQEGILERESDSTILEEKYLLNA